MEQVTAPEPLTPPECDLRGMPFMPLDVVRLTDSDLFALSTGEEFKAALTLWCKAWLQVPAGSLPDDDRILAHLSGTGPRWKKLKDTALRGFNKCSDGRLYHAVIAEKANDAWERRGEWQERQNNKTARQQRWRDHVKAASDELRSLGVTPPSGASMAELERLLVDARPSTKAPTVDACETALTGTGTGTVRSQAKPSLESKLQPSRARERETPHRAADCLNEICTAARWHPRTDEARIEALSVVDGWLAEGFNLDLVLAGISRALAKKPGKTSSLKRFTTTIRGIHSDRGGERRNGTHALPRSAGSDPEVAMGIRNLAQSLAAKMAADG